MSRWSRRIPSPQVSIEVDLHQVKMVIDELKSTKEEVGASLSKALRRTASALRVMSSKRLIPERQLRRAMDLRKRLKTMKVRAKGKDAEQVIGLWFGLSRMPVSAFKGRPVQTGKGVSFRGREYEGRFLATMPGKTHAGMFRRKGRARLPIVGQNVEIKDMVDPIIEDEIFPKATEISIRNFLHDLKWRARQRNKPSAGE